MGHQLADFRADTPNCLTQHFLDNAGSALSPTVVNEAVTEFLKLEQTVGGYVAEAQHMEDLISAQRSAAQLSGCEPDQIAFQMSATAAWLRAVSSIEFHDGDRVLITSAEYASNVIPFLQLRKSVDLSIETIPDGEDGTTDPDAFADLLDERVRAVAITHAPSQNGLVIDVDRIANVLADSPHSPWFLLDACQSAGQIPLTMNKWNVDFLAVTGRKWLRGPRGTGFLAVSQRVLDKLEPHPIDMFGSDWDGLLGYEVNPTAKRFASYEISYAGLIGLGAAIDYALDIGIGEIHSIVNSSATQLRTQLSEIPGVTVVDRGMQKSGIVVFSIHGDDPIIAADRLREQRVTVTPIGAKTNPIDIGRHPTNCSLRASPHIYNDEADLAALVNGVRALVG